MDVCALVCTLVGRGAADMADAIMLRIVDWVGVRRPGFETWLGHLLCDLERVIKPLGIVK